ncbi:MAG: hypothetical protein RLO51_26060 [Thalassobaculum sp.]|uniref:hypothetical protein n=1 Tax=Thalassobaculum sp. TaxID=2022740 RepID=UPI0032F06486
MTRHRLPLAFAVAGLLASTVAVQAAADVMAPTAAEMAYKDYHEGVYAAVECRGAVFTPADYQILESRIIQQSGGGVHAGRQLDLIEAAKSDIGKAMSHAGCGADEVKAALVRFDTIRGYQVGEVPKKQ